MVSTLAAQFFLEWLFVKFSWFSNDNSSGIITAPQLALFGHDLEYAGGPLPADPGHGAVC